LKLSNILPKIFVDVLSVIMRIEGENHQQFAFNFITAYLMMPYLLLGDPPEPSCFPPYRYNVSWDSETYNGQRAEPFIKANTFICYGDDFKGKTDPLVVTVILT